ncbi:hypothetical protein COOONC_23933 [Cooperia oncophora]
MVIVSSDYTRKYISKNYGVDATRKAFLGLIWKVRCFSLYGIVFSSFTTVDDIILYITTNRVCLLRSFHSYTLALVQFGGLCAWKIDRCLRVNAMSPQTKKIHRHMLLMLILQVSTLFF